MAINITRVYTRTGDQGETSLVGRVRISKGSEKLEAYGTIDELICFVGTARSWLDAHPSELPEAEHKGLIELLKRIQNELFDAGSILATPAGKPYETMPVITEEQIKALEEAMDGFQTYLEPLPSFVLPGGSLLNAYLHQCRAVCRRAERVIVRLAGEEELYPNVLKYVNRLSDLFFVMARYAAKRAGAEEYLWETGLRKRKPGKL